jgi:hypothetical protein
VRESRSLSSRTAQFTLAVDPPAAGVLEVPAGVEGEVRIKASRGEGAAGGIRITAHWNHPYVPILSKWAKRSGWGASRRPAPGKQTIRPDR